MAMIREATLPREWEGRHRNKMPRLSIMYWKLNGLAVDNKNLARAHVLENKIVDLIRMATWSKNAGGKMEVISIMLLKTNGDKVSEIGLSIMLLKNK